MRRGTIASVLAMTAALTTIALAPGAASASFANTLWVSAATPARGAGTSCANPGFNTIQAAVNAAPSGASINVCPGTYTEQVAITKSLNLVGIGSPTIVL